MTTNKFRVNIEVVVVYLQVIFTYSLIYELKIWRRQKRPLWQPRHPPTIVLSVWNWRETTELSLEYKIVHQNSPYLRQNCDRLSAYEVKYRIPSNKMVRKIFSTSWKPTFDCFSNLYFAEKHQTRPKTNLGKFLMGSFL